MSETLKDKLDATRGTGLYHSRVDYPIATEFDLPFTPEDVINAYRRGLFPMGDDEGEEIFWFCPDPRALLPLDNLHISRSLRRTLRREVFELSYDRAFREVMLGCAEERPVWITDRILELYNQLHAQGYAHSVEVWKGHDLVGGIYGVQIGAAFMAESKFYRETDASKIALVKLVERLRDRNFEILEVQYLTDHLASFGAYEVTLEEYLRRLRSATSKERRFVP